MSCFLLMSIPFIMDTVENLIIDDKLASYGRTNLFIGKKWYASDAMILFLITKYPFLPAFQDNLPNLATSSLFMFYSMPKLLFIPFVILKINSYQTFKHYKEARITHNTMDASRHFSSSKKLIIWGLSASNFF